MNGRSKIGRAILAFGISFIGLFCWSLLAFILRDSIGVTNPYRFPRTYWLSETLILLGLIPAIGFGPLGYRLTKPRPKQGHCPTCAYNLTGNESGICPECGTKISDNVGTIGGR